MTSLHHKSFGKSQRIQDAQLTTDTPWDASDSEVNSRSRVIQVPDASAHQRSSHFLRFSTSQDIGYTANGDDVTTGWHLSWSRSSQCAVIDLSGMATGLVVQQYLCGSRINQSVDTMVFLVEVRLLSRIANEKALRLGHLR